MSQPISRPMSVDEFFAWQESQDVRYELVGGVPLRMMAGVSNRHDQIVVNLIGTLRTALRGGRCTPFTGESAIETYPGQIRARTSASIAVPATPKPTRPPSLDS